MCHTKYDNNDSILECLFSELASIVGCDWLLKIAAQILLRQKIFNLTISLTICHTIADNLPQPCTYMYKALYNSYVYFIDRSAHKTAETVQKKKKEPL